jgi:bifunctional non-homologous end joining protein LigD
MADRLDEYRRRRDEQRTPEPVPAAARPRGRDDTFVIQQHHARRLHWDLRLERGGVLVSWALPRGVPRDPGRNHLAVHTEDHPLEYADFHGEIPAGEYGGGRMLRYDRGTYETVKWRDDEVVVVFHGERISGKYALFQTSGKDWMIHRMDPPQPSWRPMPERVAPMLPASAGDLPPDDAAWGYEMAWDGVRATGHVSGGRLRLCSGDGHDVTRTYPELRQLGESLAPIECVLDGEIVTFADAGRVYLAFDVLWLDGRHLLELPYERRRELLDGLDITGPNWQTPPYFPGGGQHALAASRAQGLAGVVAKRLDSPYRPGERSRDWLAVRHPPDRREVVVVGYRSGRSDVDALLVAERDGDGAPHYLGTVRTGLTRQALAELLPRLRRLHRRTPPVDGVPAAASRDVRWVTPRLVGDVTGRGPLRWLGRRP